MNKIYILHMQQIIRKVEERQMVRISIISLVLVKLCWFIQFEKSPVSETDEIYLHQKSVSHRRNLPPVAPTDGFEEGLVISETTEDKSQYSEFYWWTK